jgi:hypothetical protein
VPLILVAAAFRLHLAGTNASPAALGHQVGIRESLFLTGVVAVVLGGVRYRLGDLQGSSIIWDEAVELACLILANAVIAAPAILAMLLPRSWLLALTLCLFVAALGTAVELLALSFLPHIRFNQHLAWVVAHLNAIQAAWFMAVLAMLRFGGFLLISFPSAPMRP